MTNNFLTKLSISKFPTLDRYYLRSRNFQCLIYNTSANVLNLFLQIMFWSANEIETWFLTTQIPFLSYVFRFLIHERRPSIPHWCWDVFFWSRELQPSQDLQTITTADWFLDRCFTCVFFQQFLAFCKPVRRCVLLVDKDSGCLKAGEALVRFRSSSSDPQSPSQVV